MKDFDRSSSAGKRNSSGDEPAGLSAARAVIDRARRHNRFGVMRVEPEEMIDRVAG